MNPRKEYYKAQADVIKANSKKRNFEVYYCDNIEEAKNMLVEMLGEKKTIGFGGSMTIKENGVKELLASKGHELIDRNDYKTEEEIQELKKKTITADAFLTSTNAITLDGILVNCDGTSDRICYLQYGPKEVYILTGMNKVVKNEEAALKRIKEVAAPMNAIRLERGTPCTKCSECKDCFEKTICCNTVITRASRYAGRIKIILIGEELGY